MSVYIVTYDLNEETKRPPIVDEVRKTNYAMLSESSYAIDTDETVDQVYGRFEKHVDENDYIYIIGLHSPYSGLGPEQVNEWLDERLTHCG